MYGTLKILAILAIVAFNVEIWAPVIRPPPTRLEPTRPVTRKIRVDDGPNYALREVLGLLTLAGVTLLTVDAFRRTYETPRGQCAGICDCGIFFARIEFDPLLPALGNRAGSIGRGGLWQHVLRTLPGSFHRRVRRGHHHV